MKNHLESNAMRDVKRITHTDKGSVVELHCQHTRVMNGRHIPLGTERVECLEWPCYRPMREFN